MSTKTNLVLDLTIFGTFLVMYNPHLTGNTIHEWLGVSFLAAIITHLLFHWDWLVKITKEFFKKLFHQSRLNYIVNLLFFIAMTSSFFSGLLISKDVMAVLGIQLDLGQGWKSIHTLASDASLVMLGIHVALHWKWIVNTVGRYIVTPAGNIFKRNDTPRVLAAQPVRIDDNK